ncbi:hypothetical protein RF55_24385, partial [Lasius niger]
IQDAILLEEKSRRPNAKYGAEEVIFRASVDPERLPRSSRGVSLATIAATLRLLIARVLTLTLGNRSPQDLARVVIQAPGLDNPISTTLMKVVDLTVETVLSAVTKVLQSKEEIFLDAGFIMDVLTIARPVGAGRSRLYNIDVERIPRQCILNIPKDVPGLCCAMALVYGKAHLDQDRTAIERLRQRDRPALANAARALHHAAGIPEGPCSLDVLGTFENHMDVQIVVYSVENLQGVSTG